uniref:DUF4218 domain-containing protein n=1 Tax=Nicotiana tabacum TaxID=4097 RepID=A0A1S4DCE2_TOBAC|nr:PREDICTED: uncharacterized protein LOC107828309 [Nicotiana tabacum]
MKQQYCFLSLLMPRPKAPENDIDVYLEHLVDELQELWYNGADTYDASRKENFCMRAALLWTINDFPAYAYLSGCSIKGALACPSCNKKTLSTRLTYGRKFSYIGARRFLLPNHRWQGNKRYFSGEVERRHAPKILSGDDILNQLDSLEDIKFDGYSSNLSRCVKLEDRKIYGLKSHDSHILLEQLLPFAIRGILPNHVYAAITELSIFFRELCSKNVRVDVLLATQISITLSKIEKIFLPTFFDIMVHLVIHLPQEPKIVGPVQYRWMYPIKRFLRKLKCYVRNRCRPEGFIAEAYIVEESLIFCSRYLHGSERGYNPVDKNYEGGHAESCNGLSIFEQKSCPLLSDTSRTLEEVERKQAHLYVLRNCEEVQPFLDRANAQEKNSHASCGLYSLARGPFDGVQRFKRYEINGFRFHTKQLEGNRVKQNSGVLVQGIMNGQNIDYYDVLTEIVELQYPEGNRIVLSKCDWMDVDHIGKGVKIDKHSVVSINTNRKLVTNEPFVLASQVEQVFYVKNNLHPNWSIVLNGHSTYFTGGVVSEKTFQQDAQDFSCTFEKDEDFINWRRNDLDVISTDVTLADDIIEDIESDMKLMMKICYYKYLEVLDAYLVTLN